MQDTGPEDRVDQRIALTDRQGCPGVVDLAGADIEQRMDMGDWDFGLVLGLTIRADRLEDQQAPLLFEANPGEAIPLFGEKPFDMAQTVPFTSDQTGEGWGEEKAAANSHEAQEM